MKFIFFLIFIPGIKTKYKNLEKGVLDRDKTRKNQIFLKYIFSLKVFYPELKSKKIKKKSIFSPGP